MVVVVVAELGFGPVGMFGIVWECRNRRHHNHCPSAPTSDHHHKIPFCECVHTHCHHNVCLRQVIHLCLSRLPVRSFVRSSLLFPPSHTSRLGLSPQTVWLPLPCFFPLSCPSPALSLFPTSFPSFPPFLFYSLPRPLLTIIPPTYY